MTDTLVDDRRAAVPDVIAEGFDAERARTYASATSRAPHARDAEAAAVRTALDRLGIDRPGCVVELGTGQGFGTACLLERMAPDGIVHGIDASAFMLDRAKDDPRLRRHAGALDQLALPASSVDFGFSIAAFHHIPNKWLTLQELRRVLKPGAAVMIVDVTHDTPAQRVFDYVVRPHCHSGHDADFLDHAWADVLARRAGLRLESMHVAATDWRFDSEAALVDYARELFCLRLPASGVREALERWVPPRREGGDWVMPWSLGVYVMRKD